MRNLWKTKNCNNNLWISKHLEIIALIRRKILFTFLRIKSLWWGKKVMISPKLNNSSNNFKSSSRDTMSRPNHSHNNLSNKSVVEVNTVKMCLLLANPRSSKPATFKDAIQTWKITYNLYKAIPPHNQTGVRLHLAWDHNRTVKKELNKT